MRFQAPANQGRGNNSQAYNSSQFVPLTSMCRSRKIHLTPGTTRCAFNYRDGQVPRMKARLFAVGCMPLLGRSDGSKTAPNQNYYAALMSVARVPKKDL